MGITPDRSVHAPRPSLRRAGLLVLACVRMRRGAEAWAKSRRVHERIVGKLESMRRADGGARSVGAGAGSRRSLDGGAGAGAGARKSAEGQLVSSRRVSELRSEGRRR